MLDQCTRSHFTSSVTLLGRSDVSLPPLPPPLPALRDRVLSVGGDLSILSLCGEGTTITAVL